MPSPLISHCVLKGSVMYVPKHPVQSYGFHCTPLCLFPSFWSGVGQGTAHAPNQIAALWEVNRRLGAKIFFHLSAPDWLSICRYSETRRPSDLSRTEESVRPATCPTSLISQRTRSSCSVLPHSLFSIRDTSLKPISMPSSW
jgi:hypothetical protein